MSTPDAKWLFGIPKPPPLIVYEATRADGSRKRWKLDPYVLLLLGVVLYLILKTLR